MKGNIKKLVVFVIIVAIAMFTAVATASAGDHEWNHEWNHKWKHHPPAHHGIQGEYMYTGMNNCISSPSPLPSGLPAFTENNKAFTANGPVTLSLSTVQGIFTFNRHGNGSVIARQVSISLPQGITVTPPAAGSILPSASHPAATAGASEPSYDFTYEVTHDGTITLEMVPGTYKVTVLTGPGAGIAWWDIDKVLLSGMISDDYKTITLGSPEPASWIQTFPNGTKNQLICATWRFLTRVEEMHK